MFKKMPDEEIEESTNLTDTNGAAGAMDEDGELEEDNSPVVQRLTIAVYHPKGAELHTDVRCVIHTPLGMLEKRTVVPGHATAKQLGAILGGVAGW